MVPETDMAGQPLGCDPLRAARGIALGVALSSVLWLGIIITLATAW